MKLIGIGKLIFSSPKLLLRYWKFISFMVLFLPAIIISIDSAIQGEDWAQPLKEAGEFLVLHDSVLFEYTENLEFSPSGDLIDYYFNFWFSMFWEIWKSIWALLFTFLALSNLIKWWLGNDSATLRAQILAIFIMGLFQVLLIGYPFKGIISLIKFIIYEVIL